MEGRVCVITGATAGIGRFAAKGLARLGAHVVIACRSASRGEEVRAEILREVPDAKVDIAIGDLASQAAVRALAADLLARFPRIHVLVNNAGLVNLGRQVTEEGIEGVFAVNHLAPFLLTKLLEERLIESAPARVVNVASEAHRWKPLDFDDLQSERGYRTMIVYGRSKLCNILFTRDLARRLAGRGVTVNALHPGTVATQIGQNNGRWVGWLMKVLAITPFFKTPEQGADTIIYLASSPEVDGVTGEYFIDRKIKRPSRAACDEEAAARLYRVSAELTGVSS